MTIIKICGITDTNTLKHCDKNQADYVGFVFAKKSKRYVTKEKTKELLEDADLKYSKPVAVFMNNSIDEINEIVDYCGFKVIQLHNYKESDINLITKPNLLIEACSSDNLNSTNISGDLLLIDGRNPGSGNTFDWSRDIDTDKLYFIAGGLDKNNVSRAIERFNPFGVDVSSGVETNGKKDILKISDFINKVRGEDNV